MGDTMYIACLEGVADQDIFSSYLDSKTLSGPSVLIRS